MKRMITNIFSALVLVCVSTSAHADETGNPRRGFHIEKDVALMGAYAPGTGNVGGGFVVEPKLEVIDGLLVGMRTAIAITGGGSLASDDGDVAVGVGVNVSAMAKVEYEFPTGVVRPVVGLGAGLYYLISQEVNTGGNTTVRQQAGEFFGLAPQIGLQLGRARLSAAYNAVLGANIEIVQTVGEPKNIRQDYWSVELGMRF